MKPETIIFTSIGLALAVAFPWFFAIVGAGMIALGILSGLIMACIYLIKNHTQTVCIVVAFAAVHIIRRLF